MMSAGMPLLAASPEKKENKTAASADALPTLSLEGLPEVWLQGTPVKEWEKDKVYIFEFWATWCGPCLAAMPHMEQLHQAFKDNPGMQIDQGKALLFRNAAQAAFFMAAYSDQQGHLRPELHDLLRREFRGKGIHAQFHPVALVC